MIRSHSGRATLLAACAALAALCLAPVSLHAVPASPPAAAAAKQAAPKEDAIRLVRVADRLSRGSLRIVAFGSSSTEGVGASSEAASYPRRLELDLLSLVPNVTVDVVNHGVRGDDAVDLARRLPDVLAAHPDLVIFQTGTNDPLRGVPLDRFLGLTREVVARLRAAGVDVMLMEPQLCRITQASPAAALYRDAVRAVGTEMRVPVIRRWDLMQAWLRDDLVTPVQMLAPDGLHMADAGYALLAHEVAREILADSR